MQLVQTVPPTSEPITLDEAKTFLRILEDDDNATITSMIKSAREYAENYTNRQFEIATYELLAERFVQDIKLPKNPIKTLTSIEYMDENGDYQVLDSSFYYLYGEDDIFKFHFDETISHKTHKQAIKYTFVSGYDVVPESIIAYMNILISTLYENRELYIIGVSVDKLANPMALKLLDMYRVQPI